MIRAILFIVVLMPFILEGQKCTSSISKSEVLVGDTFSLEYRAEGFEKFPKQISSSNYFPSKLLTTDSLAAKWDSTLIEILQVRNSSIRTNKGKIYSRTFHLIAWDSCALSLLGFGYQAEDSIMHFPPSYLNVTYYPQNKGAEISDIKEQFYDWSASRNTDSDSKNNWLYIAIAGFVIVLCVCFYLYRKFKQRTHEKEQQTLEEKTRAQIDVLRNQELWNKGEIKEHFVQFSHILRVYLSTRFRVSFLDKTTEQSNLLLEVLALDDSLKSTVSNLLNHSDLVKFAGSTIGDSHIYGLFDDLKVIVRETSPKSEEK